ncbi:MAG TPA: 4-hydroxythreonine-4-phosphate dehydrogenase PdxA [Steroidobacteraceae bacterium]|nr:4-hydroxythreonine-4-phosphate dehydrogenase PdxA [Steroidobacteraceae bacterium]
MAARAAGRRVRQAAALRRRAAGKRRPAAARRHRPAPEPANPIALTAGEPAGIGPDLCVAVAQRARDFPLVCLADRELLAQRARLLALPLRLADYRPGLAPERGPRRLTVLHEPLAVPCRPGQLEPRNAAQVLRLIDRAVDGCLAGEFAAMVTAPVHKHLLNAAGTPFVGHTEYLAARTAAARPVMLLSAGALRVALATTHLPLRAVSAALSVAGLLQTLQVLAEGLRRGFGLPAARIGVCGLNPHAGESGDIGEEEITTIAPAIAQARAAGLAVEGPLPADTLFVPRQLALYDAVLAMYHDQGLPVLKHVGFGHAVNVTLGLPIVRTSVDHGTALTLAGRGTADSGSLFAALALAAQMVARGQAADR